MNAEDYAIVVGIQRYPGLGRTETEPRNLQGPDNDATAVAAWLTALDRGGVPAANVKLLRSKDYPPDPFPDVVGAEPQKQAIENAFSWLDSMAEQNRQQGKELRVGRRLYLYMSGHGFSPRPKQGALFLANATRRRAFHVQGSAWMEWFYAAGYFDECVLWMDCCMVPDLSVIPEPAGFRSMQALNGNRRLFTAFAACPPLQAVERKMADGNYHGVFTYTLLQGLHGAAADRATLQVTNDSLRDYMTSTMRSFLTPADLQDGSIAQEPDFGSDDEIIFCTMPALPEFPVKLRFPATVEGKTVRVVTGRPIRDAATAVVKGGASEVKLPVGVYFAIVDDGGLVKDFVVSEGAGVDVSVGL